MSLLDAGYEALMASSDPTSREAIVKAISTLDTTTMVGKVNFKDGHPFPNASVTPEIGSQWIKAPSGPKYKLDVVTFEHTNDPNVPIQQKFKPYNA